MSFLWKAESILGSISPGSSFFPDQSMGFRESNFYNSATKGRVYKIQHRFWNFFWYDMR